MNPSAVRRRRQLASDPLTKVTYRLRGRVADAVRKVVEAGESPSADVFVEEAVVAALRERRRQRLYAAYEEAASDPAFIADMDEITSAFDVTVGDGIAAEQ